jgi:uncharacterized protein YndB with AHSA1/START domain
MDTVTGAHVAIAQTVPVPLERMWSLITAVERIGEWSPEATGGAWCDGAGGPYPGARFTGHNRFPDGFVSTVTCVVTETHAPDRYAWTVLDDDGQVGSAWRYELSHGDGPGTTVVRHSFTHGPGVTGLREGAEVDPTALNRRLVTLCRHMTATIAAMVASENAAAGTEMITAVNTMGADR